MPMPECFLTSGVWLDPTAPLAGRAAVSWREIGGHGGASAPYLEAMRHDLHHCLYQ
ncbi:MULTISPECIES: hypothetical protein [unclassified Mesorhizobium]|uniref:hypothetical protein n=1 Tax=unclassified Mesorhizobium TaxID=325217 RepID=UPI0003D0362A|nr:hypothetical protein [Mesorhizobium sp. L2C084A000]ESZ30560.1 hypothetical protein X734_00810 [Mesorhizobium sp. L2C084A000]